LLKAIAESITSSSVFSGVTSILAPNHSGYTSFILGLPVTVPSPSKIWKSPASIPPLIVRASKKL